MTRSMHDIIKLLKEEHLSFGIELYPPASEEEVTEFETVKHLRLPEDIRTFYLNFNGFVSDDWIFRIIPLKEIIENNETLSLPGKSFSIAEYMIYSESWCISFNPENNDDYAIFDSDRDQRVKVTTSFTEFLNIFLTKGVMEGLYSYRPLV